MAAINILYRGYLRILTPEEIKDLTTSSEGDRRVSLTDVINYKFDGNEIDLFSKEGPGAKILPFVRKEESGSGYKGSAGREVVECIERFFIREDNAETALDEIGREVETSTFIINEKKRFAYSQAKLKGAEILSLYRKNSLVDIEQEKIIKDDLEKSTQSGILVNKKHY